MAEQVKVENVSRLIPTGPVKKYTIKLGEMLVLDPEDVPENILIIMTFINTGSEGMEIGLPDGGRRFVPTFSAADADNELIIKWGNPCINDELPENIIKVKGHFIKDLGTLTISGEGFESVEVEISGSIPGENIQMTRSRKALEEIVESQYKSTVAYFPNQAERDPDELKAEIMSDLLKNYGLTEEDLIDDTGDEDESVEE